MRFENEVVIVTGAGRGIGRAVATRLAREGATVAVNYRGDARSAEDLVVQLKRSGGNARAFQADVGSREQCHKLAGDVVDAFGRLDVVVSNAGVEDWHRLEDITEEDFQRVFATNVAGQLFMTQAAAARMREGGRIVLTSSVSARIAVFHHVLYAASKAAVSAMALNLAPELGERGITINAIAPGGTRSDMAKESAERYTHPALRDVAPELLMRSRTSLGRMAEPEEIAAAVAFLASDDASFVTGSTMIVDGGRI